MNSVREFVIEYIQREYTLPEDIDVMQLNYVDLGYIDSLGMIQFFATLEDEFNILFTDEEMVSSEVKVVGMLISMIEAKIEKNRKEY